MNSSGKVNVEDGFVPRIVSEFGLKWTQIAMFSGLLFTLFGLDAWLNPGAWTLASLLALGTVFAFRRSIRWNFPRVALAAAACLVAYLLLLFLWSRQYGDPPAILKAHRLTGTLLIAYGSMTAAAAVTLSYRRQETLFGGNYPHEIQATISRNLVDGAFFRRAQRYVLTFLDSDDTHTRVRIELSYELVNRTAETQTATAYLTPMRPHVTFLEATLGLVSVDVTSPRFRSSAGLQIPTTVGPSDSVAVALGAEVKYWSSDSDLFATYMPATELSLVVVNSLPDIEVFVECLASEAVHPITTSAGKTWVLHDGVLPYQGFKVDWFRRP